MVEGDDQLVVEAVVVKDPLLPSRELLCTVVIVMKAANVCYSVFHATQALSEIGGCSEVEVRDDEVVMEAVVVS